MLIEIEIQEDGQDLGYYCGDIDEDVFASIIDGTHSQPFIRLTKMFWPAKRPAKDEFDEDVKYVARYGMGDYQNYLGDLYVKKSHIVMMSPLRAIAHRNGAKLGDLTEEENKT